MSLYFAPLRKIDRSKVNTRDLDRILGKDNWYFYDMTDPNLLCIKVANTTEHQRLLFEIWVQDRYGNS